MISNKLFQLFIDGLSNKVNKRLVEWTILITFQFIWIFMFFISYFIITAFNGWWMAVGIVIALVLLIVTGLFQYASAKVFLNILYPPTTKMDSNGDDDEDVLDKMNRMLQLINTEVSKA